MSGLEKILEKIEAEGKEKEEKILSDAKEKAGLVISQARKKAEELMTEKKAWAQNEAEKRKTQEKSRGETEGKQLLLKERRSQLDQCFEKAQEAILNLPLPKYEAFFLFWIDQAAKGGEDLILSQGDYERLSRSGFLKKVSKKKGLTLCEERMPSEGGFLLRKEKAVTNCSLSVLISERKEELEPALAKILFEEGSA